MKLKMRENSHSFNVTDLKETMAFKYKYYDKRSLKWITIDFHV